MGRMSVATITAPEFINITSISPFVSKCEVKVLYLGQNRNGSFIDKTVATQMAQTLPGCPIVGYFNENKDDFRDHGELVTIDGDGIKFKCQTTPYGFVAPDAKVWFKDFEDTDDFGNAVIRTYLMTEGYLWTNQFKEAQKIVNEGRPQSMELDEKTLKGHWATDNNRGVEFFIINDAIFSKLCILGEDVEPCFEGASITSPDVSSNFSLNEDFTRTLHSMMKELKELTFSLKKQGGKSMEEFEVQLDAGAPVSIEAAPAPAPAAEPVVSEPKENKEETIDSTEKNSAEEGKNDSEGNAENQNITEEFTKKEEEKDSKDDAKEEEENPDDETGKEEEDKKKVAKNSLEENKLSIEEQYSLLENQYKELQNKFTSLEAENEELLQFKNKIEDKEKDNLIATFYMLSDEDKKDVIENKSKYSLEDIESKLSVICVRKKVNFNLDENTNDKHSDLPVTFNLNETEADALPAWLKAVESHRSAE